MNKPLLLMTAPVGTRSGYGNHARDIAKVLIEMDRFDVRIMDLRWGGTGRDALKTDDPDHQPIIQRLMKDNQLERQPDVHVHLTVPNEYQAMGKYNIGITAGIETTLCSAEWLQGMNRMNLNIVPSEHVKAVFLKTNWTERDKKTNKPVRQLKLDKPIEVLFEGANTNIYHKLNKGDLIPKPISDEMKSIQSSFNFLFVGHWLKGNLGQDRKDVGMLIKVFLETFKDQKNPPGLILKTSGAGFSVMDREEIMSRIKSIKALVKGDLPPIYFLHGDLTDEEMNALYNHPKVKAHITFTKGEGFGRPLLEASLSAKPIIASEYSGQLDFLKKPLATLLPGQFTKVDKSASWDKVILKESQWFTVNYSYASAVMKDVAKNYQKYELNAKKLNEINKVQFTRDKMKLEFEKLLDKYLPEFPTEVAMNLPNLPKLQKIGGNTPTIKLPKLGTGLSDYNKVTLPKLKPIKANTDKKEDNMLPIKLPKLHKE